MSRLIFALVISLSLSASACAGSAVDNDYKIIVYNYLKIENNESNLKNYRDWSAVYVKYRDVLLVGNADAEDVGLYLLIVHIAYTYNMASTTEDVSSSFDKIISGNTQSVSASLKKSPFLVSAVCRAIKSNIELSDDVNKNARLKVFGSIDCK